jgi:hypothetical protein
MDQGPHDARSPSEPVDRAVSGLLRASRAAAPFTSARWALRPIGMVLVLLIGAVGTALMRLPMLVPVAIVSFGAFLFVEAWARWRVRAALQAAGQLVSGDLKEDGWEPTRDSAVLRAQLVLQLLRTSQFGWIVVCVAGLGVWTGEPALVAAAAVFGVALFAMAGLTVRQYDARRRLLRPGVAPNTVAGFPATEFLPMPSDGPPAETETVLAWFAPVLRKQSAGRFRVRFFPSWTGADSIEHVQATENTLLVTDRAVYLACINPWGHPIDSAATVGPQSFLMPSPLRNAIASVLADGGLARLWREAGGCFSISLRRITRVYGWRCFVVFNCGPNDVVGYTLRTEAETRHLTETVVSLLPAAH